MWEAQYYHHDVPRSLITSGGLGTMGFGLPAAIGAKMARPDAEVWAIVGDGGFQMTQAELSTAAQEGVRSEEHTSELQSRPSLVCRLLLEKKKLSLFPRSMRSLAPSLLRRLSLPPMSRISLYLPFVYQPLRYPILHIF